MDVIGISKGLQTAIVKARFMADSCHCIAIMGEHGTGRTRLARFIHQISKRSAEPFIIFDAEAGTDITKGLFGNVRTTLLGKKNVTAGAACEAQGGTLFIKNLQSIPLNLQSQVLAAIEMGGYKPVGADESMKSHCNFLIGLPSESKCLPELSGILKNIINLPPLKERAEDIDLLAAYFINKWCNDLGITPKTITKSALKLLKKATWPGNIAELQRVILNAVIYSNGPVIDSHNIQLKIDGNWHKYTDEQIKQLAIEEIIEIKLRQFIERLERYDAESIHSTIMDCVERPLIKLVMEHSKGNQLKAAKMLGINRNTLRTKLQKFGLGGLHA